MDVQHIFHVEDQVFDSNQERIGTVVAVTPYYLHVTSGVLGFGHNYYIPYDAVKQATVGTIALKVPASRISKLGWEQQPGEPEETPRFGYYGTMPAPPVELAPLSPPPPFESEDAGPTPPPAFNEPAEEPPTNAPVTTTGAETPREPEPAMELPFAHVCGYKLCDAHGKRLGKIRIVNPDSLHASTGLFGFGPILRVPIDHVAHCEGGHCYLDLTAEEVEDQEWES